MSDDEFDVVDELYFLLSYKELQNRVGNTVNNFEEILFSLISNGLVKCLPEESEEEISDLSLIKMNYTNYYYLATKKGLLEHYS